MVLRQLLHIAGPEWLVAVVADPRNVQALGNSLSVGASVAVILLCVATGLALLINRLGLTGDRYIYALSLIPMLIPDYMVGVAGRALVERQDLLSGALSDQTLSGRFDALTLLALFVAVKWLPVMMVVVDARLAAIPPAILLQAKLDFASTLRKCG